MNGDENSENIENLRFLDGNLKHAEDIYEGHKKKNIEECETLGLSNLITPEYQEAIFIEMITTYVRSQVAHLERTKDRAKEKLTILGHCDLVKLTIDKLLQESDKIEMKIENKQEREKYIQKLFENDMVKEEYEKLFDVVKKQGALIDLVEYPHTLGKVIRCK